MIELLTNQFDKVLLTFVLLVLAGLSRIDPGYKEMFQMVLIAILTLVGSTHYRKSDLKEKGEPK